MPQTEERKTLYISRNSLKHTPWGHPQTCREYGLGITFYSTASHGGFEVPAELLPRISENGRRFAAKWSGSEAWYEEDCAWAYVAVAFPELFTERELESAKRLVEHYDKEMANG